VELSVTSIEAGGRQVFSAALRDITDRKKKEDQLRDADRMKDEFLAMLGHELRNPLAPIATAAEILRLGDPDRARVLRASEIVSRQVGHMTALINDLLDASRVARGRITLRRETVDLAGVVADAVEQAHSLMEARRHRLEIQPLAEPLQIEADRTRLTQVFGNLLTNAAKYTPEGGRIVLSAERREGEVVVAVSDNGVGIPAAFIPYLFDYFTQGKRTIDRSEGGLGLGLGLVKALVDLHGGRVWAESAGEGRGSTFFVSLPTAGAAARGQALGKPLPDAAHGPVLRVMIVDDNVDAAIMLSMLIMSMGHETAVFHSGAAAIEGAAATGAQLVFLDIGLPDISGYEVAPQIKRLPGMQDCMLVALTGYGATEDLERAKAAGFELHLLKPASRQDLLAVVNQVASRMRAP
jgi:CheY-like chemotaxis protein/nitrogen-specific signal transduction histidine kinase